MALLTASLVLWGATLSTKVAPPPPAPTEPPGGYWSLGEQRERAGEPKDGDDELTVGSVLLSLGLLRLGAAAVTIWMAGQPSFCPPDDPSTDCGPLRVYGWVGMGEGALMLGTGIVYLAIGSHHRRRHAAWRRGEPLSLQLGSSRARLSAQPYLLSGLRPATQSGQSATSELSAVSGLSTSGVVAPALTGGGLRLQLRF